MLLAVTKNKKVMLQTPFLLRAFAWCCTLGIEHRVYIQTCNVRSKLHCSMIKFVNHVSRIDQRFNESVALTTMNVSL